MFSSPRRARAAGLTLGYAADLLWADPRRGHPVAAFGTAAAALERVTYRNGRAAGVAHTGLLLGGSVPSGWPSSGWPCAAVPGGRPR